MTLLAVPSQVSEALWSLSLTDEDIDNFLNHSCDPALRAAMGATGRARVEEHFAWPHQEPALLAAYERALAGVAMR